MSLTVIDDAKAFHEEARYQGFCAGCAYYARSQISKLWEAHHVLEKKHCKTSGAPLNSPDNALRVCAKSMHACHERHTTHQELLPVGCLRDENIAFIVESLGPGPAYNYLRRYYSGSDPRVDALLEQS